MLRRSPCRLGLHPIESQRSQIQLLDKRIDDTHGVVFYDVIVQTLRQQTVWLRSPPSMNRFMCPALQRAVPYFIGQSAFLHSLGQEQS